MVFTLNLKRTFKGLFVDFLTKFTGDGSLKFTQDYWGILIVDMFFSFFFLSRTFCCIIVDFVINFILRTKLLLVDIFYVLFLYF